jgi:H/ACA ribonucleoprotein complex subunit 2
VLLFLELILLLTTYKKKMTKDKKQNANQQDDAMDTSTPVLGENGAGNDSENAGPGYEDKFKFMNAMASPVAPKKLAKKIFKCIKQGTKQKNYIRLGLRETQKYIRRGEKGIVVLAGNVTPIDIYSHMPVVCGKEIFF